MYILFTSPQQNTIEGDVYIIQYTPTEHLRWCCKNYKHRNNRTPKMVMYILYTSPQQNTLDGDVYIIQQQNTLDGDVYIIHIAPTEHFRW